MSVGRKKLLSMLPLFRAVAKFCSTNRLFTYFRRRYSKKQIGDLNDIVKLRCNISSTNRLFTYFRRRYLKKQTGDLNDIVKLRCNISSARQRCIADKTQRKFYLSANWARKTSVRRRQIGVVYPTNKFL